uniref:Lipid-binding serum glycoprotein N-terminal domain-containing protein n=1 Tax=Strigamia maritima TaxID=126957 RepID=T1J7Y2_STRMM
MSSSYFFLAFLCLVFSLNECNELDGSEVDERVVELLMINIIFSFKAHFAVDFVNYILNHGTSKTKSSQGNANEYVDRLFTGLREYLAKNYDPLEKKNLAPEVKSIYFEGLSTVARIGPVTLSSDGPYNFVTAHLGFHKFKGQAAFEQQLWWLFWISGTANIDVRGIEFDFKLRGHLTDDYKFKFNLETLGIRDWGKLETTLQGSNWI